MHTALYAAFAGLFLVFLSARVVSLRREERVSVGHQGNAKLERAIRVQANFIEYAPLSLLMLAMAELQGLPAWGVHVFGVVLVAGRLAHFAGFSRPEAPGRFRVLGMVMTFGVLAVLPAVLIGQLLTA